MNIKAIGRGPVRSYQADGPGVLVWDEVRVGEPGPGEDPMRRTAVNQP